MQVHGLSQDGRTITLHRFDGGVTCDRYDQDDAVKTLLVVDVETTGLDPQTDSIIEFAAAQLGYLPDGRIVRHDKTCSWLQDPGYPIPQLVTELTGITDADVAGRHIPVEAAWMLAGADLIVSHNASFDWRFCWRRWADAIEGKVWACSLQQIDWKGLGFPAARQEILTRYHGFFYDAHRAAIDVEALVRLLQMRSEPAAPTYLERLIRFVQQCRYRVEARGTPYDAKDELKQRGYRWDPERRHWWTTCTDLELADEREWLDDLYRQYRCQNAPKISQIDPADQWA